MYSWITIWILVAALASGCRSTSSRSLNIDPPAEQAQLLQMTIEGPFKDLIYNRRMDHFDPEKIEFDDPYQSVKISYNSQTIDGFVRLRGGISYCGSFPQLKLKLPKGQSVEGQREFKIITHGLYDLDPTVPIVAPMCENQLGSPADQRFINANENVLYDLSATLLDIHLKNLKFELRYLDKQNNIDIRERAYFIEDRKFAAKRYGMSSIDFMGLEWSQAWRGSSDEDTTDSIVSYLAFQQVKSGYDEFMKAHPNATEAEIYINAKQNFEKYMTDDSELIKRALAMRDEVVKERKEKQLELLRHFDRASLAQGILFEMMIMNGDWNLLGITDHGDTFKNIEVFQDSRKILYFAPYDFDLAAIQTYPITQEQYDLRFATFKKQMQTDFPGIVLPAIKAQGPEFVKRLDALQKSAAFETSLKQKLAIYSQSLKLFIASLSEE